MAVQVLMGRQRQRPQAQRQEKKEDFLDVLLKGLKVAATTTGAAVNVENLLKSQQTRDLQLAQAGRQEEQFKLGQEVNQAKLAELQSKQAEESQLARGILTPKAQSKLLAAGKSLQEVKQGTPGALQVGQQGFDPTTGETVGEAPRFVSIVDPLKQQQLTTSKAQAGKIAAETKRAEKQSDKLVAEIKNLDKLNNQNLIGGLKRKDIKQNQWVAAATATRQEASEKIFEDLAKKGFDFGSIETALVNAGTDAEGRPLLSFVAKNIKDPDQRAYATGVWNWVTAQLRKESGAAIAASEFQNEFNTFFPAPGADPQSINLKSRERARKMGTNIAEAGDQVFNFVKQKGEKFASSVYQLPDSQTLKMAKAAARPGSRKAVPSTPFMNQLSTSIDQDVATAQSNNPNINAPSQFFIRPGSLPK